MLLEPKEINVDGKTFIISKFPALAGYEIATQLTWTAVPKLGVFSEHRAMLIKMLGYVAVPMEGASQPLQLTTEALIDNQCGSWETMAKVGYSIYEYNVSFLGNGSLTGFLDGVIEKLPDFISQILTKWQGQSLPAVKQASKN